MTEWWCTRCGGPATLKAETMDPRYPLVVCRDCRVTTAGVASLAAAAVAAQLVHDRSHGVGKATPAWCPRCDGGEVILPSESRTPVGT